MGNKQMEEDFKRHWGRLMSRRPSQLYRIVTVFSQTLEKLLTALSTHILYSYFAFLHSNPGSHTLEPSTVNSTLLWFALGFSDGKWRQGPTYRGFSFSEKQAGQRETRDARMVTRGRQSFRHCRLSLLGRTLCFSVTPSAAASSLVPVFLTPSPLLVLILPFKGCGRNCPARMCSSKRKIQTKRCGSAAECLCSMWKVMCSISAVREKRKTKRIWCHDCPLCLQPHIWSLGSSDGQKQWQRECA